MRSGGSPSVAPYAAVFAADRIPIRPSDVYGYTKIRGRSDVEHGGSRADWEQLRPRGATQPTPARSGADCRDRRLPLRLRHRRHRRCAPLHAEGPQLKTNGQLQLTVAILLLGAVTGAL